MIWLDATAPAVRAAVVSGFWGKTPHSEHYARPPADPDEIDVLRDSLDRASEVLTSLTAETIHPALWVQQDFVAYPGTSRLTPKYLPLREVLSVDLVDDDGVEVGSLAGVLPFGDNMRFTDADKAMGWPSDADLAYAYFRANHCACPGTQRLRATYRAGSTITASARQAVISLAHEFYLQVSDCEDCGTCRLPTRTTSVTREGISYTVGDPLDATGSAGGLTGLPDVDLWLRGVNPRQATSHSAVYTADAPPPVVRAVAVARPLFVPHGGVATTATVTATGTVG